MGIYIGYHSPSVIRYLEPLTGDLLTARFAVGHFDKIVFSSLGGDKNFNVPVERCELSCYTPTMSYLDPCTTQSKTEVCRILDLQSIAQSMLNAFTNLANVTRSYIPTAKAPTRIDVPKVRRNTALEGRIVSKGRAAAPPTWHGTLAASQSFAPTLKRGKPPGSNDSQPQKRKTAKISDPNLNPTIAYSSVQTHEVIID
ncbi:hypothetical protein ACFX19_044193 [Malus domestica]